MKQASYTRRTRARKLKCGMSVLKVSAKKLRETQETTGFFPVVSRS
jgi:hypothetical protein